MKRVFGLVFVVTVLFAPVGISAPPTSAKKTREAFCVTKWVEVIRLESGYVMSPAQIALIDRTNTVKGCADTIAEVDAIKAGKPWPPPPPPPVRPTITRFFPTWDACFKGGGSSAGASWFGDCDWYCRNRSGKILGRISEPGAPHERCATVTIIDTKGRAK